MISLQINMCLEYTLCVNQRVIVHNSSEMYITANINRTATTWVISKSVTRFTIPNHAVFYVFRNTNHKIFYQLAIFHEGMEFHIHSLPLIFSCSR